MDLFSSIPKWSTITCTDVTGKCRLCGEPLNVKRLTGVYCGIIRGAHELSLKPDSIVDCPKCADRIWRWQFPVATKLEEVA